MKLKELLKLLELKRKNNLDKQKGLTRVNPFLFVFAFTYFGFIAFSIRATKSFKWNLVNLSAEDAAANFN